MVGGGAARSDMDRLTAQSPASWRRTSRVMKLVLEWLGLVRPDPGRREPVAVPAWATHAVAAFIAMTATGLAALLRLLIGAIV